MNNTNVFCPHTTTELINKKETYTVKGEPITIDAQVTYCNNCKEEIFDPNVDDHNLQKAYAIYRKHHDLLSPEEIVLLRKKYNLNQRAFSILIGCSQNTIVRYENGAIPDIPYNRILKLMNNPENVLLMLEDSRDKLDVKDAEQLDLVLERLCNEQREIKDLFSSFSILEASKADCYSGFKKFNVNKLISMIMFFSKEQTNLYKTKLMKLLWYADSLSFKKYVQSISGMRYIHQYYGPIPEQHDLILGVLKAAKYIDIIENGSGSGEIITTDQEVDLSCFSKTEIEILNIVNQKFKAITSSQISDISHQEDGYTCTDMHENISFEYAKKLKALN